MAAMLLPREIWVHVFRHLSTSDKMNVRASCKLFKRLVDHFSLWKDSPVVLKKVGSYNSQFWKTLCRRKTSSVVVQKANVQEWKQIARALPWLSSITLDLCFDPKTLEPLKNFSHLKRLVIRSCRCPSGLGGILAHLRQLTSLCVCEVHRVPRSEIISGVSTLSNLTSLSYHEGNKPIPKQTFHNMLRCLPNLKHLSLKMGIIYGSLPEDYLSPTELTVDPAEERRDGGVGLTSLELLNYMDPILPAMALKHLPSLRSLSVHYRDRALEPSLCHLTTWLCDLPRLAELTVTHGYPLGVYADSIPDTVQRLSLSRVIVQMHALRIVGKKVPDLLHLHLDPCMDSRGLVAEIPKLFPHLQVLKLRHHNVTEKEFRGLQELLRLKRLVVLDAHPGPSPSLRVLSNELQLQTNYRVQVIHSQEPRDSTSCLCSHY